VTRLTNNILTAKRLDPLGMAMLAIPNQSVDVSICDAGVRALSVGTGKALCVHPLRCSPAAFHLMPGAYRRRRRLRNRREGAGEATGWTIEGGAWPEKTVDRAASGCSCRLGRTMMGPAKGTKLCQRENEEEQEQEHMKVHKNPLRLK